MRVLMLGWEFPPFISGGLGTACHGLTQAMTRMGTEILFVLPTAAAVDGGCLCTTASPAPSPSRQELVKFMAVPCAMRSPYGAGLAVGYQPSLSKAGLCQESGTQSLVTAARPASLRVMGTGACGGYEGNLILRITEYADRCVRMTMHEPFEVIHAHDWVTFSAGLAISQRSGRPLIVHIHSTEFDRSGERINKAVYDIEHRGMHGATTVIAVSNLTKDIIVNRYGVPAEKVHVVHNGIEPVREPAPPRRKNRDGKVVLFLGRITMQKGPEYFLRAAQRVLTKLNDVRFVIAGWGDLGPRTIDQVVTMGLGRKIQFTGFVRGTEVQQAYRMADVYVMPSVSEPFGLTALEAIQQGVPVVLSKNSGVAEVLENGALKCDHWDVEGMADRIVAVLTRPELAQSLREQGTREIGVLTWDSAADKCHRVYGEVTGLPDGAPDGFAAPTIENGTDNYTGARVAGQA